jgi:hypothetical protein
MSELAKQAVEPTKVVRNLVVPTESQIGLKDSDRSPTKTERDVDVEMIAKQPKKSAPATEKVRKIVIPEE